MDQDPQKNKIAALNNEEARKLLETFGIALAPERLVHQRTEAVAAARNIGFPVVVKGMGANLLHKTDAGTTPHLVQLATRLGYDQGLSPG